MMECWKALLAGLWIACGVGCALDCSEVSGGAVDIYGVSYEVAVELTVCCNETDLIATLLLGRMVPDGDAIFVRVDTTITCYDELNNVTLERGPILYDRGEKNSMYANKIDNSAVRCDVSTEYRDEASFSEVFQTIATSCLPSIVPETTDPTPVETTAPTVETTDPVPVETTAPTVETTDPIPVETTAPTVETTNPVPVETTDPVPVETTAPTVDTDPIVEIIDPNSIPSTVQNSTAPPKAPDEERSTTNGHNVQFVTITILAAFGGLICLSSMMASVLFVACKWYCLQRRRSKHKLVQDYFSEMTKERVHIDFDPIDYKFPVTISLDSIATVTVPMGNHLLSSWRSESNSIMLEHSTSTDQVNKFSSSGSYLSICEDCKCKINNKEVCDCDLQSSRNEPPEFVPSAWNMGGDNSAMEEGHSLDRKSVVTVAPGELRTESHNDSGIECGFG